MNKWDKLCKNPLFFSILCMVFVFISPLILLFVLIFSIYDLLTVFSEDNVDDE